MASTLSPLSTFTQSTSASRPSAAAAARRNNMSLTQTYLLAHKARAKLAGEASRPDHDLRRLVLHANTLDGLMLELADAEREQESWFNQSVRGATTIPAAAAAAPAKSTDRHIQWADAPRVEQPEQDWPAEDDSSDDEDSDLDEDEDIVMADFHSLTRVPSRGQHLTLAAPSVGDLDYDQMDVEAEVEEPEYDDDDDEDLSGLALHRTPSHSAPSSPPELLADDVDEDSEDESMTPPSPPTEALPVFAAGRPPKPAVASSPALDARQEEDEADASAEKHALFSDSYYLRPRGAAAAAAAAGPGLVTAISVY